MKINTRQKGNAFQDWCKVWLEEAGYTVHNQKTVARQFKKAGGSFWVSQRNDIFGCIDVIAMRKDEKPLYVQCTMDTGVRKRLDELSKPLWPFEYVEVQLWQKKGQVINIKRLNADGMLVDHAKILRRKFYLKKLDFELSTE